MKTNAIVKIISVLLFGLMAWSGSAYAITTCVSNTVIDRLYFNNSSNNNEIDGRANISMEFGGSSYYVTRKSSWLDTRDADNTNHTYEFLIKAALAAYLAGTPVTLKSYHDDCTYKVSEVILND